jgi:hypothetical protein
MNFLISTIIISNISTTWIANKIFAVTQLEFMWISVIVKRRQRSTSTNFVGNLHESNFFGYEPRLSPALVTSFYTIKMKLNSV